MYSNNKDIYSFRDIGFFLHDVELDIKECEIVGKRVKYYNIPASFDIETSSFYDDDGEAITINEKDRRVSQLSDEEKSNYNPQKIAIMYIWQFGINGIIIYGREWWEFQELLKKLAKLLELNRKKRLLVYIHNLSFEFQFMREYVNIVDSLFVKDRQPVYCLTDIGIEFRCSYLLSAYNLAYLGDNIIRKYKVRKLVGDLDYSLLRSSLTPLSKSELDYCINDVKVVMSYIQEQIEQEGDISKIPLTNTGRVRKYCRSHTLEGSNGLNYRTIMKSLKISDKSEYLQLKDAFMGGFTHAGILYSNNVCKDVGSIDVSSDYPYQMVGKYFPMSKSYYIGTIDNKEKFEFLLNHYCCLFDIQLKNVQPIFEYENIISKSRCRQLFGEKVNNGRIISATQLTTTWTELDYQWAKKFYKWDAQKIINMRIYKRGYLPTDFVKSILHLYKSKTELKGIEEKIVEYMVSKNMINAAYGMSVTDIIRGDITSVTMDDVLESYNKNFNRFLFYPWGVWVTAHARATLFEGIIEFGEDYIYSDTDSIKCINIEKHRRWIEKKNHEVKLKLYEVSKIHNIPYSYFNPKTIKGITKTIGIWEEEAGYEFFKSNGAKRYMYVQNGKLNITVAGLNKKFAVPYILEKCENNFEKCFDFFKNGMYIPKEYTGKLTHAYIDDPMMGTLVDYLGGTAHYSQRSGIHLEKQDFTMSILLDYILYLNGIQLQYK